MTTLYNRDSDQKIRYSDRKLSRIAVESDELDDDADDVEIISHLINRRYDELTSDSSEEDSEEMSGSEEVRRERERLSKQVFGNDREFKSEEELSSDNDGESENLSEVDEISAERERLAKDVFQTED